MSEEFTIDQAKELLKSEAQRSNRDNEYTAKIGQDGYNKVMTGFGCPKEERVKLREAEHKFSEAAFHAHTEFLCEAIKSAVDAGDDISKVKQMTSIMADKDVLSFTSASHRAGELTVRDDTGENVKKPWEKFGMTSIELNVNRRFPKENISAMQDKVKQVYQMYAKG